MNKVKLKPEQWLALYAAFSKALKDETAVFTIGVRVIGLGRTLEALGGKSIDVEKHETLRMVSDVSKIMEPKEAFKIVRATLGDETTGQILDYLIDSLKREIDGSVSVKPGELPTPPINATIVDQPDNRLVHPGRKIIWYTPDGKQRQQRETGYFAGKLGDEGSYCFECRLLARWQEIADFYHFLTGDETIRQSGGVVVAIYTEPRTFFSPRAHYEGGGAVPRVPDLTVYTLVLDTGHRIVFEQGNLRDHIGRPGRGEFEFYDPKGVNRIKGMTWNINKQQDQFGRWVSLRW